MLTFLSRSTGRLSQGKNYTHMDINECLRSFKFRDPHRCWVVGNTNLGKWHPSVIGTPLRAVTYSFTTLFTFILLLRTIPAYYTVVVIGAMPNLDPYPKPLPGLCSTREFLHLFCYQGVIVRKRKIEDKVFRNGCNSQIPNRPSNHSSTSSLKFAPACNHSMSTLGTTRSVTPRT